jgi:hypothetical protein
MSMNPLMLARAGGLAGAALLMLVATASATGAAKPRCAGGYTAPELERMLARAQLAISLPNTESVALEPNDGCIRISVRSAGTGRLVRLILRGVAVPRAAVWVDVLPERKTSGA